MTAAPAGPRFSLDADALPFGVIVFDAGGNVRQVNAAWTRT